LTISLSSGIVSPLFTSQRSGAFSRAMDIRERTDAAMHASGPLSMHGMLTKQKKKNVIKKFQQHDGDTGSSEVQVAILSAEIDELAGHLKLHHKDHSSRRGLLRKVGERRRLLRYLQKEDSKSYEQLVKKLNLKQAKALLKTADLDGDMTDSDNAEDNS